MLNELKFERDKGLLGKSWDFSKKNNVWYLAML